MHRCVSILSVGWLLLACGGCTEPPDGLVPADGVFRWDTGETVTGHQGIVRFHPFDPEHPLIETSGQSGEQVATARVETNGRFVAQTSLKTRGKAHDFPGIKPGQYKVLLYDMCPEGVAENIHPDYNHPVRSPLLVEIKKDGANHLELTLERRFQGWDPAVAAIDRTQLDWEKPGQKDSPASAKP